MKKALSLFAVLWCLASTQVWAYDFSAVAPSGQTLYYIIDSTGAGVVDPTVGWEGYTEPTGNLIIPSTVSYDGTTLPVTTIGRYAFYSCSGLTSVIIPNSVTCIGDGAFYNCSGLTSVIIPNSVTSIDMYTFRDCSGLTSVTIGNSVTSIGEYAFYNCSGLNSVTIPNSVTSIGEGAFDNCSGLTGALTIPNSVTSIGGAAFAGCSGLTSVTIGSGVTNIAGGAFYNCTGLTEIHSLRPVAPQLGTNDNGGGVFYGVPSSIPVHIPCGSSASYYSRWSYFSNFVEEEGFTFTATSANEQQGTVQILTMPTCTSPHAVVYATANSGYHFDHWSDGSTSNPYSLTVTDDLDLIGYFVSDSGTEGISDVDADCFRIYSDNGRIVIEGAEGETTSIYDMMGRNVGNADLPAGVYMVKIGNHPARRVVVIR